MVKPFLTKAEISKTLRENKTVSHEITYWMAFSQILETRKTFTSEDILEIVSKVFTPEQPGWWGAMFNVMTKRALASGLIHKTKEKQKAKRPTARGRMLSVWEVKKGM